MVKYETELCDLVYPVGSIYMSVNSTNPKYLFGGEWEQIKDTFLLACGNDYNNGQRGGESTHTLTIDEMPSHTHIQNSHNHKTSTNGEYYVTSSISTANNTRVSYNSSGNRLVDGQLDTSTSSFHHRELTQSVTATNQNEGGDQEHNNMPPYLAVYVWERKS